MWEQDSGLDCLTAAAVWVWWQGTGQSGVPAAELVAVRRMTLAGSARS